VVASREPYEVLRPVEPVEDRLRMLGTAVRVDVAVDDQSGVGARKSAPIALSIVNSASPVSTVSRFS
jgi:hypothetical protein